MSIIEIGEQIQSLFNTLATLRRENADMKKLLRRLADDYRKGGKPTFNDIEEMDRLAAAKGGEG